MKNDSKPSRTTVSGATVSDPAAEQVSDGRKMRSVRSRRKIIDALYQLIQSGNYMPRVVEIAEEAKLSLRTVFRHMEDLETLLQVMVKEVEDDIMPIHRQPFEAKNWRGQLGEMIARRAYIYELVMPVKIAAGLRRFRSELLMQDYNRFLYEESNSLLEVLPKSVARNKTRFAALLMTMSFQAWRRLRQDQGLSPKQAEQTMEFAVWKLLQDV